MFKELLVLGLLFFVLTEGRPTRTHEDEQEEAHAVLVSDSEDGEEALQEQAEGQGYRRRRSGRRNDDDDSSEERAPPRREKIPRLSRTGEDSEDAGDEEIGNQRRGWSSRKHTPRPRHSSRVSAKPPRRRPADQDDEDGYWFDVEDNLMIGPKPTAASQLVFRPAVEDDESAEERPATRKAKSRKTTPAPENSDEGSEERDEPPPRGRTAKPKAAKRNRQLESDEPRRRRALKQSLVDEESQLGAVRAADEEALLEEELRKSQRKLNALKRKQGYQ